MNIDNKILEELKRYNKINQYIFEQDAALPPPPGGELPPPPEGALPPPPGGEAPPAGATPPTPPPTDTPQPVDTETDPDVEKIGDEKENKKELEITDLVKSQQNVEKKQEEYFDNLFKHLEDLETRLSSMDTIVNKLNDLEAKVEKYRTKTPEERLELRSYDSGPFNQKLSQFFEDKQDEFEKTGKNEYILTKDEVEDFSPTDIKNSFRNLEIGRENDLQKFK
jgi:hypothetical protein